MLIIPAVDLKSDNVVRLYKGDFNKLVRYDADAADVVRSYLAAGTKRLHIVFLWGAHTGKLSGNEEAALKKIIDMRNIHDKNCTIQLGGGIRKYGQIKNLTRQGIDFVILSTSLLIPLALNEGFSKNDIKFFYQQGGKEFDENKELPEIDLIDRIEGGMKEKIMVAVDYRADETALSGWEVSLPLTPGYVIKKLMEKGYKKFVITNVEKDGTLEGIDVKSIENILGSVYLNAGRPDEIIISGGITSERDIENLQKMRYKPNGLIIGKALYQKKLDIKSVIKKFQLEK